MRTLREQIAEMTQIILAEGAADDRDAAVFHLLRAGFRPRFIAACLDSVMASAREATKPVIINKTPAFLWMVQ